MQVSTCPAQNELEKLVSGRLPPPDVETLMQHLETCPTCFAKVPALAAKSDTLLDLLAQAKTPPAGWQDPIVSRLIAKLIQLRKAPDPGPQKVIFPCPACGKNMKAGAELVGKNLKCPSCAQVIVMPPQAQLAIRPTDVDAKTLPPREPSSVIQGIAISGVTHVPAPETFPFLAPAQQPDELGRLGNYRVLKKLGSGGMGIVFLAEDTLLHRKVALKTMLPAYAASVHNRERFLREARAAASIEHDHIVAIYQVGEENNVPYLAMPLLRGEPLDARLDREGKLPVPEALRIAADMAEGLSAAHVAGLIHRDVKPGNVWLETKDEGERMKDERVSSSFILPPSSFRVKLLDFGLARSQHENVRLTQSGAVLGTPAYMAPEQAQGEDVDARADLFSLGCVLYEMLTGERPFRGENTISLLAALALQDPTPPHVKNPAVPVAVSELTMRLLAKKPADRPASAREVARQLRSDLLRPAAKPSPAKKISPEGVKKIAGAMGKFAGKAVTQGGVAGLQAGRGLIKRPRLAAAVACFFIFAWLFGGAIWRVATNRGELVIESDDPNLVVTVKGETVTLYDKVKDRRFVLTAGEYDVEVREEGDGGVRFATKRFTISGGGKETFHARLEQLQEGVPLPEPDPWQKDDMVLGRPEALPGDLRKAWEDAGALPGWMIWHQRKGPGFGYILGAARSKTKGAPMEPGPAGALPAFIFESPAHGTAVGGLPAPERGFGIAFAGNNYNSGPSDAGLRGLGKYKKLRWLTLNSPNISNAALKEVGELKQLQALTLTSNEVTDKGLKHLAQLQHLRYLDLTARVTEEGIKELCNFKQLRSLKLNTVTDAGLKDLATLKQLEALDVGYAGPVTDAGLKHLVALKNLEWLNLAATEVTDAGLSNLRSLKQLQWLGFPPRPGYETQDGYKELRKALPSLQIN